MAAWFFKDKNKHFKDSRKSVISAQNEVTKKLDEACSEEKNSIEETDYYFNSKRKNPWNYFKEPINADIAVVCIDITEEMEKVKKFIEASLKFYNTKFYKFIFFSNSIYSTDIYLKSLINKEELFEIVKIQKEISDELKSDNVLLYDAIDESILYSKEGEFCSDRIISIGNDKFILEDRKYLFVISGKELGSNISKEDLQILLNIIRYEDLDIHVVLTKSSNLAKILSLGFRTIKSY